MSQELGQTLGIQWCLKPGLAPVPMELAVNHTDTQPQKTTVFDPSEGKGWRTQPSLEC